jgi:hypothetical protein
MCLVQVKAEVEAAMLRSSSFKLLEGLCSPSLRA